MMNRMLGNGRVYRMARLLKEPLPHIIGHLEFLLKNAYEHLPKSGRLSRDDLLAIEEWALWDGKEGAFRKQLLASNLIFARKNGTFFAEFWKEAPKFVQNRWRRKELGANLFRELMPKWGISDAPVGHHRGPRAEQSRAGQTSGEKRRAEQSRAGQTSREQSRAGQTSGEKRRAQRMLLYHGKRIARLTFLLLALLRLHNWYGCWPKSPMCPRAFSWPGRAWTARWP